MGQDSQIRKEIWEVTCANENAGKSDKISLEKTGGES
jgi:hypothetical protein